MKLEKTWMGICVWVIYLVGMIFAIGVTGFISGLFPSYDRYYVAGGTAACGILVAIVLGLVFNAAIQGIVKKSGLDSFKKPVWLEILLPIVILVAAFFAFGYSQSIVKDFTGDIQLYDSAVIAASGQDIILSSFADKAYVAVLKVFMGFLGNSLNTAYALHLVLRLLLVLFLYISIRVVLGMIPALAGSIAVIAIPSFGYSLKSVASSQLTFTAFFFLLMLTILYVYGFYTAASTRWYYKLISILFGAFLGFMIYFEAASATVIPFLIAAWVLYDMYGETINVCVNEIIVLIAGVLSFGAMLIYEGGPDSIPDTYYHWTWRFYGYNENAWLLMVKGSPYNTYLALGLLVAALIPAVLFFKKRCTKTSPFIMCSVLGLVASVFLGETAANSEVMIIAFVVILICCGIAAMIHVNEIEIYSHEKATENEPEDETAENGYEVVTPEEIVAEEAVLEEAAYEEAIADEDNSDASDEDTVDEEAVTEEIAEDKIEEEKTEEVETKEVEKEEAETSGENNIEENITENVEELQDDIPETEKGPIEKNQETPRYVPEGMVLPMGEEDEEDLVPNFNMNRLQTQDIGILSVGGSENADEKNLPKDKAPVSRKDDFDINIAPGDDFDI
ncbi:hypothetical protein [Butyrivibrio sp. VCD2006]|uniref:hypothetical protein n=1 Tax=Butyrivibrio sp. VCD2006 TaxID=1280664 RepID=UPI000419ED4F|nr:hypothetical protein [Butyrivibrio sp. VCD2006]